VCLPAFISPSPIAIGNPQIYGDRGFYECSSSF
jgi:hypothetical protein